MKPMVRKGLLLALGLSTLAFAQERKFRVYGFADAQIQKFNVDDNNPLLLEGFDGDLKFRLANVNLYYDFRPNDKIRTLIETGLHWQPHGTHNTGIIQVNKFPDGFPAPDISDTTQDAETTNNTVDLVSGGEVPVYQLSLPRAWFEYGFNQYFNLRVGKFITPAGIWNVDHGSPIIVTARQPFQTGMIEIFPKSQMGFMGSGTAYLGDFDLDYKLFVSSGRSVQAIDKASETSVGANVKFKAPSVGDGLEIGLSGYTGVEKESEYWATLGVLLQVDGEGNVIGGTPEVDADGNLAFDYEKNNTKQQRENIFGVDVKYNLKGLLLQGELNYSKLQNQLMDDAESSVLGVYALAGYKFRVHPKFSIMPYALYEYVGGNDVYDYDKGMKINDVNILSSGFTDDMASIIGGLNFNVFTNSTIKLEYAHLNLNKDSNTDAQNDNMNFGVFTCQFAVAF